MNRFFLHPSSVFYVVLFVKWWNYCIYASFCLIFIFFKCSSWFLSKHIMSFRIFVWGKNAWFVVLLHHIMRCFSNAVHKRHRKRAYPDPLCFQCVPCHRCFCWCLYTVPLSSRFFVASRSLSVHLSCLSIVFVFNVTRWRTTNEWMAKTKNHNHSTIARKVI